MPVFSMLILEAEIWEDRTESLVELSIWAAKQATIEDFYLTSQDWTLDMTWVTISSLHKCIIPTLTLQILVTIFS